jgi:hypothetical protein
VKRAGGVKRAAIWALLAALALPLYPQNPSEPSDRISARERELAGLRAEIGRLEARLGEARRRQSGLQDELAAADLELKLQEARLAEAMTASNGPSTTPGATCATVSPPSTASAARGICGSSSPSIRTGPSSPPCA